MVRATTDNSASGLIARVSVEPGESLILRWRWKVSNVYEQGNARTKEGDDYPARIYVAFEFEPDEAGFFERAKRKTVEVVFGEELPGNALNYIWANRLPVGEIVANPFTDTTMMVAGELRCHQHRRMGHGGAGHRRGLPQGLWPQATETGGQSPLCRIPTIPEPLPSPGMAMSAWSNQIDDAKQTHRTHHDGIGKRHHNHPPVGQSHQGSNG